MVNLNISVYMSTRCNIGILDGDGGITGIYVHWDGYPKHSGKMLLNHYMDPGYIYELMDLGDLSQLCENVYSVGKHSFNDPEPKVCVAYGRDRGEKDVESRYFEDIGEFEEFGRNTGSDYQYLFDNGVWTYRNVRNGGWKVLTAEVCGGK